MTRTIDPGLPPTEGLSLGDVTLAPRPMRVVAAGPSRLRVAAGDGESAEATIAFAAPALRPGDRVLVVMGADACLYAIGAIQDASPRSRVAAPSGAAAELAEDGETLHLRDAEGRLVLSYDPVARRTTLMAAEGDLVLAAPAGSVAIEAGRGVSLSAPDLAVASQRADLRIARLGLAGTEATATVQRAGLTARRLDLLVETVVERLGALYRTVAGLCQTRAGRMRVLVDDSLHLSGKRSFLRAAEEVRLTGRKIHLG